MEHGLNALPTEYLKTHYEFETILECKPSSDKHCLSEETISHLLLFFCFHGKGIKNIYMSISIMDLTSSVASDWVWYWRVGYE